MTTVGIDPGLSGAIAVYSDGRILACYDMPVVVILRNHKKKREVDAVQLADILRVWDGDAFVEQVGAMPGQGVTSMFAFGKSYGVILGALGALHIPHTRVPPQVWRKAMGVRGGKEGSVLRASELMPDAAHFWTRKKDNGRAEAALIACYGAEKAK